MTKKQDLYTGRGGHFAVMAELLIRGYNVAIPEVDTGDDVFVVQDDSGEMWRVQVKAANAKQHPKGFQAQFSIKGRQLSSPASPDVNYVFAVRRQERWQDFLIIERSALKDLYETHKAGSTDREKLTLTVVFSDGDARALKHSLQQYRNHWAKWPSITH
jgi:hypothetical protein